MVERMPLEKSFYTGKIDKPVHKNNKYLGFINKINNISLGDFQMHGLNNYSRVSISLFSYSVILQN